MDMDDSGKQMLSLRKSKEKVNEWIGLHRSSAYPEGGEDNNPYTPDLQSTKILHKPILVFH